MPAPERRFVTYASPVRVQQRADKPPVIAGYASVFYDGSEATEYQLWSYGNERCVERIMPGAFARAIKEEDDCRALYNHNPDAVLGRTSAGTCTLREDETGLAYEIEPPETMMAKDLMVSIGRGDITGSSFSFIPEDQSFREVREGDQVTVIREVNSVRLFDVGPVTYPAYEGSTTGVRAAGDVEEARAALAAWRAARSLPATLAGYRARAAEVGL